MIVLPVSKIKKFTEGTTVLDLATHAQISDIRIVESGIVTLTLTYGVASGNTFTASAIIPPLTLTVNSETGEYSTASGTLNGSVPAEFLSAVKAQVAGLRNFAEQAAVQFGLGGVQIPWN